MQFLGIPTPILIDGGMATSLEAKGVAMHPTLWTGGAAIDAPFQVSEVHADFLEAGANLLITDSYQLTPQALVSLGYDQEQIRDILMRTVELAARACLDRPHTLIAASVGPYGAYLCDGSEYRGQYDVGHEALVYFHQERFEILSQSNCDLVLFETIPCMSELVAILEVIRNSTKPVWISMCCRDGTELSSGEHVGQAARRIHFASSVVAIGVNCVSPRHVSSLVRIMKFATTKPVFVYPNLGQVWDPVAREWSGKVDAAQFLSLVDEWLDLGVAGVGGCCGVDSSLIRAMGERIEKRKAN